MLCVLVYLLIVVNVILCVVVLLENIIMFVCSYVIKLFSIRCGMSVIGVILINILFFLIRKYGCMFGWVSSVLMVCVNCSGEVVDVMVVSRCGWFLGVVRWVDRVMSGFGEGVIVM